MNPSIKKVYSELACRNLDGILLSHPPNISYISGIISRDSYLLVYSKKTYYLTDSRYTEEAKRTIKGIDVRSITGSLAKTVADLARQNGLLRLGFEERYLSFAQVASLKEELGGIELVPAGGVIEQLRQIKTAAELDKIKTALSITVKAFNFIRKFISAGRAELEIAAELERFIRYNGATSSGFDIIVASGPNSAYPHHLTSSRKVQKNDVVLVDMGVDYFGYKSDLTRVFFLGKINSLFSKIYNIVSKAQIAAIKKIRPGTKISDIDAAGRGYIRKKGFGGFFSHNLGHGVGLEVHELPRISAGCNERLQPGMVFSVEPAIYLAGKFGIRIEDMCLVTGKGVEVLSGALDK